MKLTKKKVLVIALAVSLISIMSLGTLAWFQASDSVTNIFQVTTDDQTQRPDFKLELFEHKLDTATGQLGTEEVKTNTYPHIAPGSVLPKDPTVRNSGSYDQWVRIKATLTGYADWETALGADYDFNAILSNVSTDWSLDGTTI